MKNALLGLNIVLLLAVGFLFYKVFSNQSHTGPTVTKVSRNDTSKASTGGCRIAYFEMDSVDNNCDMVKDVRAELEKKGNSNINELSQMEQRLMEKRDQFERQAKAGSMTQQQGELAQQELYEGGQKMQGRKQELDQQYQNLYIRLNTEMKKNIAAFLEEYNNANTYSYIFAYEDGLFFYKDSAYNITRDVVNGLNLMYRDQKAKKK